MEEERQEADYWWHWLSAVNLSLLNSCEERLRNANNLEAHCIAKQVSSQLQHICVTTKIPGNTMKIVIASGR